MTYKGKVRGGVVVLEPGVRLDEGTDVVVEPTPAMQGLEPRRKDLSLLERLAPVVGKAKGLPADAARNIDRDLYGRVCP
jgi:hypothetical protein